MARIFCRALVGSANGTFSKSCGSKSCSRIVAAVSRFGRVARDVCSGKCIVIDVCSVTATSRGKGVGTKRVLLPPNGMPFILSRSSIYCCRCVSKSKFTAGLVMSRRKGVHGRCIRSSNDVSMNSCSVIPLVSHFMRRRPSFSCENTGKVITLANCGKVLNCHASDDCRAHPSSLSTSGMG